MRCMRGCLTCLYCFFNITYLIVGLSHIITGIVIITEGKSINEDGTSGADMKDIAPYFIILGIFMFTIGILGFTVWCCCENNRHLSRTYLSLIGIKLVVTISISIIFLAAYPQRRAILKKFMAKHQSKYKESDVSKRFWDNIQIGFVCCGVDNRTDWLEYMPEPPKSCCNENADPATESKEKDSNCAKHNDKKPYLLYSGCLNTTMYWARKHRSGLIVTVCFDCIMQVTCFILTILWIYLKRRDANQDQPETL